MKCSCRSVDDGEGGHVIKYCPLHAAASDLVLALSKLLTATHDRDRGFLVEREGKSVEEIYNAAIEEAKRVLRPLNYFERPRGIRDLPGAPPPA
jgi:hypothetical protein